MRLTPLLSLLAAGLLAFTSAPALAQSGVSSGGRIQVQGGSAQNAAATGNPVPAGCTYNSTQPTITAGNRSECQIGTRGQLRVLMTAQSVTGVDGVSNGNSSSVNLDSDNAANGPRPLIISPLVYNGTSWDRVRGDQSGTVVQPALVSTHWAYPAASGGLSNTTTAVTIKAAGGGGGLNCITGVQVSAGPLGAATEVAIRDGAGGTVLWRSFLGTAGGLTSATFAVPVCGSAATLLEVVTLTATVTGGVYVNAQGFTR